MNFEMKELPRQQSDRVRDRRIERVVELVSPAEILEDLPLGPDREDAVLAHRAEVESVLDRDDDRLLVVVGPCSVHDPEAARRLRPAAERPREGAGGRPLRRDARLLREAAHDHWVEGPDQRPAPGRVRRRERRAAHRPAAAARGDGPRPGDRLRVPRPDHAAVHLRRRSPGARSAPGRPRARSTGSSASGLSMPVGFKNGTAGSVKLAVDAVRAAAAPHAFAGVDVSGTPAILYTEGNPDCHVILRGGRGAPNYDPETVAGTLEGLRDAGLPERLVIDASHDNSGKDHERQPQVVSEIADQIAAGNERDRRGDDGVVPGRGPPGPRIRMATWSTASRSPTPAWTGTRRC